MSVFLCIFKMKFSVSTNRFFLPCDAPRISLTHYIHIRKFVDFLFIIVGVTECGDAFKN